MHSTRGPWRLLPPEGLSPGKHGLCARGDARVVQPQRPCQPHNHATAPRPWAHCARPSASQSSLFWEHRSPQAPCPKTQFLLTPCPRAALWVAGEGRPSPPPHTPRTGALRGARVSPGPPGLPRAEGFPQAAAARLCASDQRR